MEMVISCVFFGFRKTANSNQACPKPSLIEPYWGILALGQFLYEPCCAESVQPQPQAKIPQYGP